MTKIEDVQKPDLRETILEILKNEKYPLTEEELLTTVERETGLALSKRDLESYLDVLEDQGYDIKKITAREHDSYVLVRHAESDEDEIYRPLGQIDTPVLLTGDFHIGHKNFSRQAYEAMVQDIEEYGIEDVLAVGDIVQGLGVHRQERKDLKYTSIDKQVDVACDLLSDITKNATFHCTIGNHEEKIKGKHKVGFDPLKAISKRLDNFKYYGSVMTFDFNGSFSYTGMHTSGTPSYSISYPLQKVMRNLPDPRPDILHIGHIHRLCWFSKPGNKLLLCSGTLQREASYIIWKGHIAELGWLILEEFDRENKLVRERTPEVY